MQGSLFFLFLSKKCISVWPSLQISLPWDYGASALFACGSPSTVPGRQHALTNIRWWNVKCLFSLRVLGKLFYCCRLGSCAPRYIPGWLYEGDKGQDPRALSVYCFYTLNEMIPSLPSKIKITSLGGSCYYRCLHPDWPVLPTGEGLQKQSGPSSPGTHLNPTARTILGAM